MTNIKNPTPPATPRLLSINDACQTLGVSRWTMYQLINHHRIKTVRVLGRHLIAPEDLDDFVEQLRNQEDHHDA